MNISLEQAIEIHARVLRYRVGRGAAELAGERAKSCDAHGDREGYEIWLRVRAAIELLREREPVVH